MGPARLVNLSRSRSRWNQGLKIEDTSRKSKGSLLCGGWSWILSTQYSPLEGGSWLHTTFIFWAQVNCDLVVRNLEKKVTGNDAFPWRPFTFKRSSCATCYATYPLLSHPRILMSNVSTNSDADAYWELVHCQICFHHFINPENPKAPPPIPFWVTNCGHVLCNNHLSKLSSELS